MSRPNSILISDIDSTIFDHSERHRVSYLAACGREPKEKAVEHPANMAYPLFETRELDLTMEEIERYFEVFDSPDHLRLDRPIGCSNIALSEAREWGMEIIYLTGRPGDVMEEGTMDSFSEYGFPVPNGKDVKLIMKPPSSMSRANYKQIALRNIKRRKAHVVAGIGDLLEDAFLYSRFSIQPIILNLKGQSSNWFPKETLLVTNWDDIRSWLHDYKESSL